MQTFLVEGWGRAYFLFLFIYLFIYLFIFDQSVLRHPYAAYFSIQI
jgi:hypothetical protein